MDQVALIAFLVSYVVVCGFIMYFCVIADPNESKIAFFMTATLPEYLMKQLSKVVGDAVLHKLANFMERFLQLLYLAVVLGGWTVVFWFVYPWMTASSYVANVHKYVGYALFVACFWSWRKTCTTSPGFITKQSYQRYNHFPFDNLLFVADKKCDTTGLIRIARSKYDRIKYNRNVPRYDHFCGWVYNTIGEENYRWFFLFLTIHVAMCVYGATICAMLLRGEIIEQRLLEMVFFDRATGETVKASNMIVAQYLFAKRMPECAMFLIMAVMGIALFCFWGYHFSITSRNITTNEDGKWQDVKAWYKRQKKEYNQAVKDGLVKSDEGSPGDESKTDALNIQDGDVTCTPGLGPKGKNAGVTVNTKIQQQKPKQEYFDPGPMPKNLYNRGFVENWKEVLFPQSLRIPKKGKKTQ